MGGPAVNSGISRLPVLIALLLLVVAGVVVATFLGRSREIRGTEEVAEAPVASEAPVAAAPETQAAARTVVFDIEGMHCDGCVQRITKFLEEVPGVQSAHVDLEKEEATVHLEAAETGDELLVAAVAEAGYEAKPRGIPSQ